MAKLDHEEAKKIYGDLLKQIADAYVTKDFDAFSQLFHLPHHITTPTERFVLRSSDELKAIFDLCCTMLVTDDGRTLEREVVDAKFKGQDKIDGAHRTIFPDGIDTSKRPHRTKNILMWIGMRWQVCAAEYQIDENSPICQVLRQAQKA